MKDVFLLYNELIFSDNRGDIVHPVRDADYPLSRRKTMNYIKTCLLSAVGILCWIGIAGAQWHPGPPPFHGPPSGSPPGPPPSVGKRVVAWQHVKEQCYGRPYEKIAEQCGNRVDFWHGIYCRVQWSDGSVTELHGRIDQVDPLGRAYCTGASRPRNFNCVSQCDYTDGPLMTLP